MRAPKTSRTLVDMDAGNARGRSANRMRAAALFLRGIGGCRRRALKIAALAVFCGWPAILAADPLWLWLSVIFSPFALLAWKWPRAGGAILVAVGLIGGLVAGVVSDFGFAFTEGVSASEITAAEHQARLLVGGGPVVSGLLFMAAGWWTWWTRREPEGTSGLMRRLRGG